LKPGPKKTGVKAVTYSLGLKHEKKVLTYRRKYKLKNRSSALREILDNVVV